MKKIKIETELEVFESILELPVDIQDLMNKAHEARKNAYAPYSFFKVGAAIALASGEVVTGNNQENAAFPSGLCAERVAAFYAGAQFPNDVFTAIALTAGSLKHNTITPIPPCGACRQSLAEYEVNQKSLIPIYFMGATGKVVKANSVKDLLPLVFDSSYL
ncbi:MAG: cytidine deaminase [Flavobacteriaceae bacterium]|nr:cytidine deaminase [Flavobacteriaceae bacterium]